MNIRNRPAGISLDGNLFLGSSRTAPPQTRAALLTVSTGAVGVKLFLLRERSKHGLVELKHHLRDLGTNRYASGSSYAVMQCHASRIPSVPRLSRQRVRGHCWCEGQGISPEIPLRRIRSRTTSKRFGATDLKADDGGGQKRKPKQFQRRESRCRARVEQAHRWDHLEYQCRRYQHPDNVSTLRSFH